MCIISIFQSSKTQPEKKHQKRDLARADGRAKCALPTCMGQLQSSDGEKQNLTFVVCSRTASRGKFHVPILCNHYFSQAVTSLREVAIVKCGMELVNDLSTTMVWKKYLRTSDIFRY